MSHTRRWIGFLLMGAGAALGVYAERSAARLEAERETERQAAAGATLKAAQRAEAEARVLEAQAVQAAALDPLNAAVGSHIDGPTLIDLFEHEEWWQPFRDEFASAAVIVGNSVLGRWGRIDVGGVAEPAVQAARKQRVGSVRAVIGGQAYLVLAARMNALPEEEPVLVLAKLLAPAPAPAPMAAPAPTWLSDRRVPLGGAGALALIGLVLVVMRGSRRDASHPPTLATRPHQGGTAQYPTSSAVAAPAGLPDSPHPPELDSLSVPPIEPPSAAVQAVAPMDSGRQFGRYRVIERLGESEMSEFFTAETSGVEGFTRLFVLKRLRPELARDKEAVTQFIDEARLQATLVHSNIVPVFDFGTVGDGEHFVTQEYIVGRDLMRIMMRYNEHFYGGLEPPLAFYLAYETLQALAYAHEKRDKDNLPVIHRAVAPGNVMISLQGEVKLADFGAAKGTLRVVRTVIEMVKANANFMAPEQARGKHVDARSDLFSLAAVLFYCLTGEPLYGGENDLDVLHRAAQGPTESHHARIADLPDPAPSILARALSIHPNGRFQTATEFAEPLAAFSGGKRLAAKLLEDLFGDELRSHAA